jgi:hypothetical protein
VRSELIAEAARRQPVIDNRGPAVVVRDASEGLISRMADGLYSPHQSRARTARGARVRLCEVQRPGAAHPSGARAEHAGQPDGAADARHAHDFGLLGAAAELFNKSLFTLRAAPSPITQVFRRTTMADFRSRHVLEVSTARRWSW